MPDIWGVRQISENRWQLYLVVGQDADVRAEGTFEAILAAKRLLDEDQNNKVRKVLEEGRALRDSIESKYRRLTTLTAEDFAVRSR